MIFRKYNQLSTFQINGFIAGEYLTLGKPVKSSSCWCHSSALGFLSDHRVAHNFVVIADKRSLAFFCQIADLLLVHPIWSGNEIVY